MKRFINTERKQTEKNLPPNVLTTSNKLDCHARPADGGNGARNDGKIFPLSGEADCELRASLCDKMAKPLQAQSVDPLNASNQAGAHRAGEGKKFAQQTETNLPSYRPNVLSTSNKLDCFARPADGGNGARNDEKPLVPQYLSALVPSKKAAFTKPSRGTSDSERRTIINGNRVFRFDCERCRLTRGAAFTLAEVLITLGIIGVVAAMTMPTLIQNHQKKVLATKAKKTYSNIQNAFLAIQNEYGTIGDNSVLFDPSATSKSIAQELLPHFNGAKFCYLGSCPLTNYTIKYAKDYYGEGGALKTLNFYPMPVLLLPDSAIIAPAEVIPNCYRVDTDTTYDKDGNVATNPHLKTYCGTMYFDVNGPKPPNEFGKDVFYIGIEKNKIVPSDWDKVGGDTLTNILTGKE